MASESPPAAGSVVAAEIKELERHQAEIRRWQTGAVLLVFLIMGLCAWQIVGAFTDLATEGPQQELFIQNVGEGVKQHVLPGAQRLGSQTVTRLVPELQKELDKINERAPDITDAALKELALLAEHLPERGERVLAKTFGEMMLTREANLRKQYPDLTGAGATTLVRNLAHVAEEQADEITAILFAEHLNAIDHISGDLQIIAKAEATNITQEIPNWQVGLMLFDLFRDEIRPLEVPLVPDTNAAPAKVKKPRAKK